MSTYEQIYESQKLQEQLIPAKLNELRAEMDKDSQLNQLLTTKARNLPEGYKFLLEELTEEYEDKTLYYLIETCLTWKKAWGSNIKSYFSRVGEKLIGTLT